VTDRPDHIPPEPDRTPLNDPDRVAGWVLGDDPSSGVTPEQAGKLLAADAGLRRAVAERMFVHGLLRSLHDLDTDASKARVARVAAALARGVGPAEDTVPSPLRLRTFWSRARAVAAAAGVLLAVGIGMQFLPAVGPGPGGGGTGPGIGVAEASAADIVGRAETAAAEPTDREYLVSVRGEGDVRLRESRLFVRGDKWVLAWDDRVPGPAAGAGGVVAVPVGGAMGWDGRQDWLVLSNGRNPPEWVKGRLADRIRGLLQGSEVQAVQPSEMMRDLRRSFELTVDPPEPAPLSDRTGGSATAAADCLHVHGLRRTGSVRRVDVWADRRTGLPVVMEMQLLPVPLVKARKIVFEHVGDTRRPDGFYEESFHRASGGAKT
jgi:hypothetical protein